MKPPETVTAAHEDVVLGPDPEESEVQKEAGCAVSDELPSVHLRWVHPHAERNQVGTNYSLWPNM